MKKSCSFFKQHEIKVQLQETDIYCQFTTSCTVQGCVRVKRVYKRDVDKYGY
mgnify:CR=1 FL=1